MSTKCLWKYCMPSVKQKPKDCIESFNPSKECVHDPWKGWRITWNPSTLPRTMSAILRRVQVLRAIFNPLKDCVILRRVEGSRVWSLEGSRDCAILRRVEDCVQSFNPSKDCICNPLKGWRLRAVQSFNYSKHCTIVRRVEGPCVILQPFEALRSRSLEGLKDCVRSFKPSKHCICNPWKGWRIARNPSTLRRTTSAILSNPSTLVNW